MFRKIGLVILITALAMSACGRQVTPDRTGSLNGLPSGSMSVLFTVGGQLDFSNYQYAIVFDTAGGLTDPTTAGLTPLPVGLPNNYQGYSFAIVVTAVAGLVQPELIQYIRPQSLTQAPLPYFCPTLPNSSPPQLNLTQNSNGAGTQFKLIFQRTILDGCFTGSLPYAPVWSFNAFSLQQPNATGVNQFAIASEQITDSLGTLGPTDISYTSLALDTTTAFDYTIQTSAGTHPPSTRANALVSVEIANNP